MRQSNFELLRIVSMFAILLSHILIHGFKEIDNFNQTDNYIWHQLINSFLMIHVNLFLLISGYWGIKLKWSSFYNLLKKCFFYSVLIYLVWALYNGNAISLHDILVRASFIYKKNPWWFVYVYIQLCALSPVLNIVINNISQKQYIKILCLLLFFNCIIGGLLKSDFNPNGFTVHHFILMYFIGGYLRRYDVFQSLSFKKLLVMYGITSLITFCIGQMSIRLWSGYVNPFVIMGAVFVFVVFKRIKVQSRMINRIAASAFSVYLIHDEDTIMRSLMSNIGNVIYSYTDCFFVYFPILIIIALAIFVMSVLLDKVSDWLLRPFTFIGTWKIDSWLSGKINRL